MKYKELKKKRDDLSKFRKSIEKRVFKYPTKHKEGFIQIEIDALLKEFKNVNLDRFNNALRGITCMMKGEEIIIYHCDVEKALLCGIENRELYSYEWD